MAGLFIKEPNHARSTHALRCERSIDRCAGASSALQKSSEWSQTGLDNNSSAAANPHHRQGRAP